LIRHHSEIENLTASYCSDMTQFSGLKSHILQQILACNGWPRRTLSHGSKLHIRSTCSRDGCRSPRRMAGRWLPCPVAPLL